MPLLPAKAVTREDIVATINILNQAISLVDRQHTAGIGWFMRDVIDETLTKFGYDGWTEFIAAAGRDDLDPKIPLFEIMKEVFRTFSGRYEHFAQVIISVVHKNQ